MRTQHDRSGWRHGAPMPFGVARRHRSGLVAWAILGALTPAAHGDQIWVDKNNAQCSDQGPGSQQIPFCTINAAVADDDTGSGDEVIVRPGTYEEQLWFRGKAITVRSEQGADVTTITGDWTTQTIPVVKFVNWETASSVLQGFSITHGKGSGIFCDYSSPTISECIIRGNSWLGKGGGIRLRQSNATIEDCTICQNAADGGGGVYVENDGSVSITRCTIEGNRAVGNNGGGGGIYFDRLSGTPVISHSVVRDNYAERYGGGILGPFPVSAASEHNAPELDTSPCDDGDRNDLIVDNCLIFGNTADVYGGGVLFADGTRPTVSNTTIADNYAFQYGGGLHSWCSCTTIVNSIVWSNVSFLMDGSDLSYSNGAELRVRYSDVEGGEDGVYAAGTGALVWGDGNIDADPLFCDPIIWDYHLDPESPVIDEGDNEEVLSDVDYDGNDRIVDGDGDEVDEVDMGAYEYQNEDCADNGLPLQCPCPEGTITEADPPDGTRDARQPHPPADNGLSARQGIGSPNSYTGGPEPITITLADGEEPVEGADSLSCWHLCETGIEAVDPQYPPNPPLDSNRITKVTETSAGVYEMLLERPISAGHWTTIEYAGDGSYVTYSSLPADSNADRTSAPSDILALVNCCLNQVCTPPHGDYSCDMNRDGAWTSADTSRLIDLLNGAQTFISWLYKRLPTNTCPDAGEFLGGMNSEPSVSELNAEFIDGFVTYVSTAVMVDVDAEQWFKVIVDALTEFSVEHLSAAERKALAERLQDPSLTFESNAAADIVPGIVERLLR